MAVVVLTTPGAGTWTVPAGVTSVVVECWGGGGAGAKGAAGGGGAWSSGSLAVTAGQSLNYSIAAPQAYAQSGAKTVGQDTWFGTGIVVRAKGADGHLGGQALAGSGSPKFSGGSTRFVDQDGQPGGIYEALYGGSAGAASKNGAGGDRYYSAATDITTGGASPGGGAAGQSNVEGGGGALGVGIGGSPGGGSRAATSTRGQIRLTYEGATDPTPAGEEITEKFKTPDTITWTVPAGVTSVTAQVWGPGGAGADGTSSRAGGGGGGGGFRQATAYPVTTGQAISLRVGAQGTSSFFVSTSICQANSGAASTGQGPGAAGTHSGSAAGFGFNGGAGNWGGGGATANGGSAGSSASPTANGAPSLGGDGELRGGGGSYGNYSTLSPAGPGQQPGGGGGGGYSNSPAGAGGAGQIFLTYTRAVAPTRRAPRFFHWL